MNVIHYRVTRLKSRVVASQGHCERKKGKEMMNEFLAVLILMFVALFFQITGDFIVAILELRRQKKLRKINNFLRRGNITKA